MALFPFVLVKEKHLADNEILMNHELIHIRQQLELLILPFYLWYGMEYFIRLAQYKNHYQAYRNISFEREAYQNQKKCNYLKNRKLWSFIRYL